MRVLLDTQILVWMVDGDKRLRQAVRAAVVNPEASLHVSAITAYEYSDLLSRGRLPVAATIDDLTARFDIRLEMLPLEIWRIASSLPHIHGDPVDRMTVAHAIIGGFTLATADGHIRQYPVKTL